MRRRKTIAVAMAMLLGAAAACSSGSSEDEKADKQPTTVAVLSSASLSEEFAELGRRFEAAHPGTKVDFSFSATNELAERVRSDWPADLLVAADEETVPALVAEGRAMDAKVFARNPLSIVVAKGNPKGIHSLADLTRPDITVALCAVEAPCGRLTAQVISRAGLTITPKSYDANVRSLVAKLAFGEADAGIVFATNMRNMVAQLDGVDIPTEQNLSAVYPMARLRQAKQAALADAFTAFVLSEEGRQVLAGFGLLPP